MIFGKSRGRTTIGTAASPVQQDVVIQGFGIESEHCYLEHEDDGDVYLHPVALLCAVDGLQIHKPIKLQSGCMICLGRSTYFRYNNPQEKKRSQDGQTDRRSINNSTKSLPDAILHKEYLRHLPSSSVIHDKEASAPSLDTPSPLCIRRSTVNGVLALKKTRKSTETLWKKQAFLRNLRSSSYFLHLKEVVGPVTRPSSLQRNRRLWKHESMGWPIPQQVQLLTSDQFLPPQHEKSMLDQWVNLLLLQSTVSVLSLSHHCRIKQYRDDPSNQNIPTCEQ